MILVKQRGIKIEKRPMWFSDMSGTAEMLAEKAQEGWLVTGLETVKGEFTFRKSEPEDCFYYFQPSESRENLAVYTDSDFVKVQEGNGLALWKRRECDPAGMDNLRKNFRGTTAEEEEQWLEEQAKEGRILLRVSRPEYTFLLTAPERQNYRIVYDEDVKDYGAFLKKYTDCGWEYVWGNNGYHYFNAPVEKHCSEAPFDRKQNNSALLLRRQRVFNAFLAFSAGLLIFSLIITGMNFYKYMGLTAFPVPDAQTQQKIIAVSRDVSFNFIAVVLSLIFTGISFGLRLRLSRQRKKLKREGQGQNTLQSK